MNTTTAAAPELPPLDPAIRTQVQDQCRAVVGLCKAIAELHSDYEKVIALNSMSPTLLQMTGERTAKLMEYLGDVLNGQDATTDDDAWMDPIFEKAHAMFPIERPALAAQQPAASPPGWKLVPECPYEAQPMIAAFLKEETRPGGTESDCYRAMLAAAPAVPAASGEPAALNSHERYWVQIRHKVVAALAAEGLRILSDKNRVWLERVGKVTAHGGPAGTTGEQA